MNLLDIYKKLPRINCGECPAKTCMAFAVKLANRELSLSECIKLTEQARKGIDAMLSDVRDWKEKRLEELFKEISQINFQDIAEGIGAVGGKDFLKIHYLGKTVSISHSDFEDKLNLWDKLLILMYIKNSGNKPLSGTWTAFRDLKNGLLRAPGFNEICEAPLAKMFGENKEGFLKKIVLLGAKKVTGFSAEYSFIVYPLPKIPFLVLLWSAQENFESVCKVLLDSTAAEYLDIEALLYLGQAVVMAIKSS